MNKTVLKAILQVHKEQNFHEKKYFFVFILNDFFDRIRNNLRNNGRSQG